MLMEKIKHYQKADERKHRPPNTRSTRANVKERVGHRNCSRISIPVFASGLLRKADNSPVRTMKKPKSGRLIVIPFVDLLIARNLLIPQSEMPNEDSGVN